MELHCAYGDIELRGDFLVCKVLENAVQHLLLAAADSDSGSEGASSAQKLLSTLGNCMKKRLLRNDHQVEILGGLASHQAVHSEQAGNFVDGHAAVGVSIHTESHGARGAFAQDIAFRKQLRWLTRYGY